MGDKMNILIDYLTISFKCFDLKKTLEILKLEESKMMETYSYFGLEKCLNYDGIKVHVGEYIIIDMSGKGCRLLETLYNKEINWIDFIEQFLSNEGSHISRLDIACDDKPTAEEKPILNFNTLAKYTMQRKYISLANRKIVIDGDEQNIIFGSSRSDRRLRIYNKALERGVEGHWIRAEFQLRNDTALSFYMRAMELGSIGLAYQVMLYNYLRYTTKENDTEIKHQSRLIVTDWWNKFCNTSKKIKGFYIGGADYNFSGLEKFLQKQVGSSLNTYLRINEGDITSLLEIIESSTLNKKQEFLIKTEMLKRACEKKYNYEYELKSGQLDEHF